MPVAAAHKDRPDQIPQRTTCFPHQGRAHLRIGGYDAGVVAGKGACWGLMLKYLRCFDAGLAMYFLHASKARNYRIDRRYDCTWIVGQHVFERNDFIKKTKPP